jgi:hypothetical protein
VIDYNQLIVFKSRREALANTNPDIILRDVSSHGVYPLKLLSPFVSTGPIPVPGKQGIQAQSVEGIWQGLKIIDGEIDTDYFDKCHSKRDKTEIWDYQGKELDVIQARRLIYYPAYFYKWKYQVKSKLKWELLEPALNSQVQWFFDFGDNPDPLNPNKSWCHSALIVYFLKEKLYKMGKLENPPDMFLGKDVTGNEF